MRSPALEVVDLVVEYPAGTARGWGLGTERRRVRAVDGVNFLVERGSCLGLVGESGSGKTTIGRALTQLMSYDGAVIVAGLDLGLLTRRRRRQERRRVQMVFQNPYGSLDPMMSIASQLKEVVDRSLRSEAAKRIETTLQAVGMSGDTISINHILRRYPHQFSGGQRQRLSIARALLAQPDVIILDEPFSALDVSIQAQISNVLRSLKESGELTMILISHDLAAIRHLADHVAVLYAGQIVEYGEVSAVYGRPSHPYTKALLASTLDTTSNAHAHGLPHIEGEVPDPSTPPPACRFEPRCPWSQSVCRESIPRLNSETDRHSAACHFSDELATEPWPVSGLRAAASRSHSTTTGA